MSARYFVIEEGPLGREFPAICPDELPRNPVNRIVYALRLDTLHHAARWMKMDLARLHREYRCRLADGTLPASNIGKGSSAH